MATLKLGNARSAQTLEPSRPHPNVPALVLMQTEVTLESISSFKIAELKPGPKLLRRGDPSREGMMELDKTLSQKVCDATAIGRANLIQAS